MNTSHSNKGVGLEAEGFFLDSNGRAVEQVRYMDRLVPTSEFVLHQIARLHPQLQNFVSPELVSVTIEAKTGVHTSFESAVSEIFMLRSTINNLLEDQEVQLHFVPVIEKPYRLLPSIMYREGLAPESIVPTPVRERIHKILQGFGYSHDITDVHHPLYASTIASLQINDSRFLGEDLQSTYEKLRRIYNHLNSNIHSLLVHNSTLKDFRGKERMENYTEFLQSMKTEQFTRRGYDTSKIVYPDAFPTTEALLEYFAVHADVDSFDADIDAKSINGFLKYKPQIGATEVRVIDAQPTQKKAMEVCQSYERIMRDLAA